MVKQPIFRMMLYDTMAKTSNHNGDTIFWSRFIVIHCVNFVTDAVPKCSFQEPSGELCPTDATKSIRLSACAMASAWQGERDPECFSPIEITSQSYRGYPQK